MKRAITNYISYMLMTNGEFNQAIKKQIIF